MPRRLSYANVSATLALVFSMSGGALAANHYLISSAKQINPTVLKKLKGASGKAGAPGAQGAAGAAGAAGKEGAPGKEGVPGKTGERGPSDVWQAGGESSNPPLTLSLPAGTYLVQAKTVIDGGKGNDVCSVSGGSSSDSAYGATSETATGIPQMTLNNLETTVLSTPGTVELTCGGSATHFSRAKLTATEVGTLH
jgi:hypothetical protein